MTYAVIVTPEAQANIAEAYRYIAVKRQAPRNAATWLRGLHQAIDSLESRPRRCPAAREQDHFPEELRQLVFKSYRIIFTLDDAARTVHVLYVRHARRRAVGEPDEQEE